MRNLLYVLALLLPQITLFANTSEVYFEKLLHGRADTLKLHSFYVSAKGENLVENYFSGEDEIWGNPIGNINFDHNSLHDLRSATKSIVGLIIGICIDKGLIKSVNEKVLEFFPEYKDKLGDLRLQQLTIEHLLTMTAGFEWNELSTSYSDPDTKNDAIKMSRSKEKSFYVLSRPMKSKPGVIFEYNGGLTQILADVIEKVTKKNIEENFREFVIKPMEIHDYDWTKYEDGSPVAASGLRLRLRDFLRIVDLFTYYGFDKKTNAQIVSKSWIEESVKKRVTADRAPITGYGYHLWFARVGEKDFPIFIGNGGQYGLIDQDSGRSIVAHHGFYNDFSSQRRNQFFSLVWHYFNWAKLPAWIVEILYNLQEQAINKSDVNWDDIYTRLSRSEEHMETIKDIVREVGANHSGYFTEVEWEGIVKYRNEQDYSSNLDIDFHVRGNIGVLKIKGFNGFDPQAMQLYWKKLADKIMAAEKSSIKGLILDISENSGGHLPIQVLGLSQLFGKQVIKNIYYDSKTAENYLLQVSEGKLFVDDSLQYENPYYWYSSKLESLDLALYIGPETASSGEGLAVALRNRIKQPIIYGENSAGLATGNIVIPLEHSGVLVLTVESMQGASQLDQGYFVVPDIKLSSLDEAIKDFSSKIELDMRGIVYRIEDKKGLQRGYVFATDHTADPETVRYTERFFYR